MAADVRNSARVEAIKRILGERYVSSRWLFGCHGVSRRRKSSKLQLFSLLVLLLFDEATACDRHAVAHVDRKSDGADESFDDIYLDALRMRPTRIFCLKTCFSADAQTVRVHGWFT